jgi:hypothetical protein
VAGAFDTIESPVTSATVVAPATDPTAALMRGWLGSRLGHLPRLKATNEYPRMREVRLICANGDEVSLTRDVDSAVLRRTGQNDRDLPLTRRPLGEELAEELRRLDADETYAAALSALTGAKRLNDRPPMRVHIWQDPAVSEAPEEMTTRGGRSKAGAGKTAVAAASAPSRRGVTASTRSAGGKPTARRDATANRKPASGRNAASGRPANGSNGASAGGRGDGR